MKKVITIFILPFSAAIGMEMDETNKSLLQPMQAANQKIEIITDANKKDSYSVAVSLCIKQSDRGEFAQKVQQIYNAENLKLDYVDEGKFWQVPHITLAIFEKVKLENIDKFHGIIEYLGAPSLQFINSTCAYFGKGDWLVTKPNRPIELKIKELNARVIDWAQANIMPAMYKVQRNTAKNKIIPHMALNTTVKTIDLETKRCITRKLNKALKAMPITLEEVIITATNEW